MTPLVNKWRIIVNARHIWTMWIFLSPFLSKHNRKTHHSLPTHLNNCKLLTGKAPNMPKKNATVDPRVEKAVSLVQKCPAVTVKEGMIITGFLKE
jgi:hypothetical protein